ncbi:HEPN domain-containing protein [Lentilactobacillus sp. SPB1-3]|uniref:HEPN domain-containing protein n=1 Tax=Lentilactobacillus terminaliae TaxID=3003483 RepID=A0ACD5DFI4_9LACO|nr:HEPN domain-containing protein [Lentilactobacillus sp. SPB1-3]MCZ0976676.1 hypothetical protein [Lentilactobacillus sp. SPB1-3]
MNSNISQQSSFIVNASFGIDEDKLFVPGTLEFDSTNLYISSNSKDLRQIIETGKLIYGIGTLISHDKNNQEFITPVYLTLDGFASVINNNALTHIGGSFYEKDEVISCFIGDFFVNEHTEFEDILINLTNLSNWLSGSLNNPEYLIPDINKDFATINTPETNDILASSNKNEKLRLIRHNFYYNSQNSVTAVTSSIGVTNNIELKDVKSSLPNFLLLNQQVKNWYNLLTGTSESIYKITGTVTITDSSDNSSRIEVQLFKSNSPKTNLNDFSFITTWSQRTSDWYQNCINSLYTWKESYDQLMPINNSIRPDFLGDTDQQLQAECVSLEMIFDTFCDVEYRKKEGLSKDDDIYYVNKIKYILTTKINQNILKESLLKYNNNITVNDFSKKIKKTRNTLSHSSSMVNNIPLEERMRLQTLLKIIIRDWLLSKISIKRKYIDAEYEVTKPFNFSITKTW